MKGLQKQKKDAPKTAGPVVDAESLRQRLLGWYRASRRALPWRASRDAYPVMVSEFMLQQTRVEVVEPRFVEFLRRFPSVSSLALATREDVHDQWSGLGYYRRADLLHGAARAIVERGGFPETADELRTLPGFGPYTSAAVASIAFEEAVPVLDGNVERVCARVLTEEESPKRAAARRRILARLEEWIDREAPGDFNQAMMELGATVCRPKVPRCASCPLEQLCGARAEGAPTSYPPPPPRRSRENWNWVQFVVFDEARESVQLRRRDAGSGQLAGRWELPGFCAQQPTMAETARQAERLTLRLGVRLGTFDHSITHRDYRVELFEAHPIPEHPETREVSGSTAGAAGRATHWVHLEDFDDRGRWQGGGPLPASSMLSKAVRRIRAVSAQRQL